MLEREREREREREIGCWKKRWEMEKRWRKIGREFKVSGIGGGF